MLLCVCVIGYDVLCMACVIWLTVCDMLHISCGSVCVLFDAWCIVMGVSHTTQYTTVNMYGTPIPT